MNSLPVSEDEIQSFRMDTGGTAQIIHFNNAGCSLPTDKVVKTLTDYIQQEAVYGGYELEDQHRPELENVYSQIARLIHAEADEIALVENASTAWGVAFNGMDFKKGDQVLTSEYEYASNFIGLVNAQKKRGIEIKVIPNDEKGNFSLSELEKAISPRTKLIAVTHILSAGGGVLPVVEIGEIASRHQILYLLDACQSIGQLPVNVKEIQCDMLAATGRKYLRAPRGTGFLYVKKKTQDMLSPILMDGHSTEWMTGSDFKLRKDARRFEMYEKNRALILGMGVAIEYALNIGVERIWERIRKLAGSLRVQLLLMEGITVHDQGDVQCGIVSFSVAGLTAALIKNQLSLKKINVSVAVARSAPFYMHKNQLDNLVRASLHYYNTDEEIAFFCKTLSTIINKMPVAALISE